MINIKHTHYEASKALEFMIMLFIIFFWLYLFVTAFQSISMPVCLVISSIFRKSAAAVMGVKT